ncbi:MAG: anthrone oxygenase family protein [Geminicoccaceae bacterium]
MLLAVLAFTSLLLHGAIFGFFYAWVCSTMWGLDTLEPAVAIEAMRGMNASVRNAVFAPAFFATPFVSLLTALVARRNGETGAATAFALAGLTYLAGGMLFTMLVNVPMNRELATLVLPDDPQALARIWNAYSAPWQICNQLRTAASGLAMLFCGAGLYLLRPTATQERPA